MSLKSAIDDILATKPYVARTLPAWYDAAAYTIFTVTGGLVAINAILVYHDTAVAGAVTLTTVLGGVATSGDAGAFTCAGAIGTITVLPLGNVAQVAPTGAEPWPTLLAAPGFFFNRIMGPVLGTIVTTVGLAMAVAERISFRCIYTKIDPEASVS